MRRIIQGLRNLVGLSFKRSTHLEKWISGAGGLVGIMGVLLVSQHTLGLQGSAGLVASMGASAVLLFAVPHGPLSQPWQVFGGHMVSSVVGVGCAQYIPEPELAAACAVAMAIAAMYYMRCIHPPGGATALTAVTGGEAVHSLGYSYVLTPVLINVLIILFVAIIFNWPFAWRRYPVALTRFGVGKNGENAVKTVQPLSAGPVPDIPQSSMQTVEGERKPGEVIIGRYYCNGDFGEEWQVRKVLKMPESIDRRELVYMVVAGHQRRTVKRVSVEEFKRWANYEVWPNENSWQRVAIVGDRLSNTA